MPHNPFLDYVVQFRASCAAYTNSYQLVLTSFLLYVQCNSDGIWSWSTYTDSHAFPRTLLYKQLLEDSKPPAPKPVPNDGNPHIKLKPVGAVDECWLEGFKWPSTESQTLELVGVPEDTKEVRWQLPSSQQMSVML